MQRLPASSIALSSELSLAQLKRRPLTSSVISNVSVIVVILDCRSFAHVKALSPVAAALRNRGLAFASRIQIRLNSAERWVSSAPSAAV